MYNGAVQYVMFQYSPICVLCFTKKRKRGALCEPEDQAWECLWLLSTVFPAEFEFHVAVQLDAEDEDWLLFYCSASSEVAGWFC